MSDFVIVYNNLPSEFQGQNPKNNFDFNYAFSLREASKERNIIGYSTAYSYPQYCGYLNQNYFKQFRYDFEDWLRFIDFIDVFLLKKFFDNIKLNTTNIKEVGNFLKQIQKQTYIYLKNVKCDCQQQMNRYLANYQICKGYVQPQSLYQFNYQKGKDAYEEGMQEYMQQKGYKQIEQAYEKWQKGQITQAEYYEIIEDVHRRAVEYGQEKRQKYWDLAYRYLDIARDYYQLHRYQIDKAFEENTKITWIVEEKRQGVINNVDKFFDEKRQLLSKKRDQLEQKIKEEDTKIENLKDFRLYFNTLQDYVSKCMEQYLYLEDWYSSVQIPNSRMIESGLVVNKNIQNLYKAYYYAINACSLIRKNFYQMNKGKKIRVFVNRKQKSRSYNRGKLYVNNEIKQSEPETVKIELLDYTFGLYSLPKLNSYNAEYIDDVQQVYFQYHNSDKFCSQILTDEITMVFGQEEEQQNKWFSQTNYQYQIYIDNFTDEDLFMAVVGYNSVFSFGCSMPPSSEFRQTEQHLFWGRVIFLQNDNYGIPIVVKAGQRTTINSQFFDSYLQNQLENKECSDSHGTTFLQHFSVKLTIDWKKYLDEEFIEKNINYKFFDKEVFYKVFGIKQGDKK